MGPGDLNGPWGPQWGRETSMGHGTRTGPRDHNGAGYHKGVPVTRKSGHYTRGLGDNNGAQGLQWGPRTTMGPRDHKGA